MRVPAGCLVLLIALCAPPAAARTHAVLVGVAEYPNLERSLWLEGPRNDVQLFHQFLRERGVAAADIQVLADGVGIAGAALPTRKAILDALAAVAERAGSGDYVLVLFAGHGSQAPVRPGDTGEPDGLDEIFLPRDVGRWDGERGDLPNAIRDDEIGAALERIRDRGAFVWAIFDSCHSGTLTRALPAPGERDRQVRPARLGIPDGALAGAAARGARTRGEPKREAAALDGAADSEHKGGLVAFYAAQSSETTPEANLPLYAADARPRGLFSYTLHAVMSARPDATYRQVIEQVLQRYQGLGRNQPTPMVEGTALDATLLGSEVVAGPQQWRVDRDGGALRLRAGVLHGVSRDSILAIVPEAASKDDELLGYATVTAAATTSAVLAPVAYQGRPAFAPDRLAGGSAYARPVDLKVDFTLRVAPPVRGGGCAAPTPAISEVIAELRSRPAIAPRVRWVRAGEAADVRLCVAGGRLLFLDGSGTLDGRPEARHAGVAVPPGNRPAAKGELSPAARELGQALERVGRVVNLFRVAGEVAATAPRIGVELELKRKCTREPAAGPCDAHPRAIQPTDRPELHDGDELRVTVTNLTGKPVDFTALYADAAYGISALYPGAGESARLPPRGSVTFDVSIVAEPAGFERLLFIAVPAEPLSPEVSFAGLAQSGLALAGTRGSAGTGGLQALFEDAAFGSAPAGTTRGTGGRVGSPAAAQFSTYAWTVAR